MVKCNRKVKIHIERQFLYLGLQKNNEIGVFSPKTKRKQSEKGIEKIALFLQIPQIAVILDKRKCIYISFLIFIHYHYHPKL